MLATAPALRLPLAIRGVRFGCRLANAVPRTTSQQPARPPIEATALRRVILHAPNWLGDCVMALPAAERLRAACPGAAITVVTRPMLRDLWQRCASVDRVLTFERFDRSFSLRAVAGMARRLRAEAFEAAVILPTGIEFALLYALAGTRIRAGYDFDDRRPLLTHPLAADGDFRSRHLSESYAALVSLLGGPPAPPSALPPPALPSVPRRSRPERRQVIVHPGATYGPAKRWPAQRFAELGRRLAESCAAEIVLVGGAETAALAAEINAAMGFRARDLSGRTSLAALIDLMQESALVISSDSGPAHLADALGVPLIVLFGSTSPQWTGPRTASSEVIRQPIECSPCFAPSCRFGTLACFDGITTEEVFVRAVQRLGEAV